MGRYDAPADMEKAQNPLLDLILSENLEVAHYVEHKPTHPCGTFGIGIGVIIEGEKISTGFTYTSPRGREHALQRATIWWQQRLSQRTSHA